MINSISNPVTTNIPIFIPRWNISLLQAIKDHVKLWEEGDVDFGLVVKVNKATIEKMSYGPALSVNIPNTFLSL